MQHLPDRKSFTALAPAASLVFSYADSLGELEHFPLEFEYAMIDQASARAVAKFACTNCVSCRQATVWVSALTQMDGTWAISHTIGSIS
jgi:hypothetical protein